MEKQELKINVPIPDGMVLKSVKSEIKDGAVVVIPEYEEKPKYKDGDILALKHGGVFIYNSNALPQWGGNNYYAGVRRDSSLSIKKNYCLDYFFGYQSEIRGFATEEEKQKLFDVLAKNGYKWNAETKELEKFLPRVPKGEKFFAFNGFLEVFKREEECDFLCNGYYKAGNYFLTEEEAKRAAKKAKGAIKR
ncbi:hypothetical protein [Bacteroides pyogenes]|uniref:hypothetical protein n=1 Tax=Bacteroides pyogenes TaxID=310300 RepID=UPI001BA8DD53|nr:hypothetical protein [Bacteroides pyogenes]MBR8704892.1 hypothetical protein [Bacteroides pyogenes]